MRLNIRIAKAHIFYSLKESMLIEAHLKSFDTHIKRVKGISPDLRAVYQNSSGFIKRLSKARTEEELLTLAEDLDKPKVMIDRKWIRDQIDARLYSKERLAQK